MRTDLPCSFHFQIDRLTQAMRVELSRPLPEVSDLISGL